MSKMSARILFVLTSHGTLGRTGRSTGWYLSEAAHPYAVMRDAGFEIDFASPEGGAAPMDGLSRTDPTNAAFLDDADAMAKVQHTLALDSVDPASYDAIYLVGGHGTMWDLPDNQALSRLVANIHDRGGVVGAVCHGVAGLVNTRLANGDLLVAGKAVSAFTNAEEEAVGLTKEVPFLLESRLRERGADVRTAANFAPMVSVADRLITGQNPASARGVGEAMVDVLLVASALTAPTDQNRTT
jgi:putative intracellular protease/amidase